MKLLMVGNFSHYVYENALCDSLVHYYEVNKFKINDNSVFDKLLTYKKINISFCEYVLERKPDVIFFYRTNLIQTATIKKIKRTRPNVKFILYHNDNPYEGIFNSIRYHFFLKLIPFMDLVYCYRESNFKQAIERGAKNVKLFLPHYSSKIHHKDTGVDMAKMNDVVFIGHYEKDGRDEYIDVLVKNNIDVKIFGSDVWVKIAKKKGWPTNIISKNVYNDDYRKTIAFAKIGLCFLSKKHKDCYTRRCFEIPAIGTLLLSEYTEELDNLFKENVGAVFFRTPNDLLNKVIELLANDSQREEISISGYNCVVAECSEKNRAEMIKNDIERLYEER